MYVVRQPSADGELYGGDSQDFDTWEEAKGYAESLSGVSFVDYAIWEPYWHEGYDLGSWEYTDFYAEHFEGDWTIENATKGETA